MSIIIIEHRDEETVTTYYAHPETIRIAQSKNAIHLYIADSVTTSSYKITKDTFVAIRWHVCEIEDNYFEGLADRILSSVREEESEEFEIEIDHRKESKNDD